MSVKRDLNAGVARHSIFTAMVGPRPVLAPEDGNGNGGAAGGGGGAGGEASGGGAAGAGAGGGAAAGGEGSGQGGEGGAGAGAGGAAGGGEGGDKSLLAGLAGDPAKPGTEAGKEGDPAKPAGEGGEPKEGEGKPATDDGKPKDVDGKEVPETYEIKMPDGVKMDEGLLAEVTPMFRDAKLSPAQAQVVADAYMKQQTKALEAHGEQVKAWATEAKSDKEFGGKEFDANMGHARKAFVQFGSERALQIFDTYGLGNNPDVLRMFVRIGKAMGEGGTVLGGDGGGRVSAARDMYPDMYKGK